MKKDNRKVFKNEKTEYAANHFVSLYGEEIKEKEAKGIDIAYGDVVYEWWTQNKGDYPTVDYDELEALIFSKIC